MPYLTVRLSPDYIYSTKLTLPRSSTDKESWLPALECLFELQSKAPDSRFTIIEAWSVDSPNHGRAAILNEAQLMNLPQGICESDPLATVAPAC